jgi:putative ABC transport system permease protein
MTPNQIIEAIHQQSHSFTILLGAIGGISLIVGGIGIMNIMMVSVVERRREIGLRLAIGARRRDIAWLFLMEAIILSMAGGVAGFGLGMVVSFIFGRISDIEFIVSGISIPLGLFVSLVVGIFFGYYPASRAARLDPVQALHNE